MSERKVLNVSIIIIIFANYSANHASSIEILPPGLRSIEDSAHETGQKSAIHSPIDGAV